jgi:Flp pilus assembly protein TadD
MEAAFRRALDLQPTHVQALAAFGVMLSTRQKLEEALPLFDRAEQADPLAAFPYSLRGAGLLVCGKREECLRCCDDALSFEHENLIGLWVSAMAKVARGDFDEGVARAERAVAVSHRGPFFVGILGWALATAGRKDDARTILAELRARPVSAPTTVSEAWLLGALGEVDPAFEVVARAEEECQAFLYYTGLPAFDPLRADPRFAALLGRLGLSAGTLAPSGA